MSKKVKPKQKNKDKLLNQIDRIKNLLEKTMIKKNKKVMKKEVTVKEVTEVEIIKELTKIMNKIKQEKKGIKVMVFIHIKNDTMIIQDKPKIVIIKKIFNKVIYNK